MCFTRRQIAASHKVSSVSTYEVDLTRVKKSGKSLIQDSQTLTEPKDPKTAALRRRYECSAPASSTQRYQMSG